MHASYAYTALTGPSRINQYRTLGPFQGSDTCRPTARSWMPKKTGHSAVVVLRAVGGGGRGGGGEGAAACVREHQERQEHQRSMSWPQPYASPVEGEALVPPGAGWGGGGRLKPRSPAGAGGGVGGGVGVGVASAPTPACESPSSHHGAARGCQRGTSPAAATTWSSLSPSCSAARGPSARLRKKLVSSGESPLVSGASEKGGLPCGRVCVSARACVLVSTVCLCMCRRRRVGPARDSSGARLGDAAGTRGRRRRSNRLSPSSPLPPPPPTLRPKQEQQALQLR